MLNKIAVFLSKNGADLQNIIDACADYKIRGTVDFAISSSKDSLALKRAADAGISYLFYEKERFPTKAEFYQEIMRELKRREIDWIVLLEYEHRLPEFFIDAFYPRILSCYPALDFSYLGKKDIGVLSASDSLAKGVTQMGCTIHVVQSGWDYIGPILATETVPVFETDEIWHLYNRVRKAEHYSLPKVLRRCCNGELEIRQDGTVIEHPPKAETLF